ncbi:MAG: hypothetical protein ACYCWE_21620 [Eubacteriales bacterium]
MKLRIIFVLLIIVTSVTAILSCSDPIDASVAETTASVSESETNAETLRENYKDNIPDGLDFEGANIKIHGRGDGDAILELSTEQTGDIIEDAIYERNRMVEERLKVKIEAFTPYGWQNYGTALTQIRSSIQAGDDEFQIIAGYSAPAPVLSTEKLLLNLRTVPYIETDQPWWAQSIVNDLTIKDSLYFLCGDIALTMLASSYSMAVNFNIAEQYNISGIYDTVLDGKWTIDKLYELSSLVYKDSNGDGKTNEGDVVGLLIGSEIYNDADSFMQGSKIKMTERGDDGLPFLSVDSDKMTTLVGKVYRLFYENPGALVDKKINAYEIFPNDTALFTPSYLYFYYDYYKNMDSDYGILPYPKFNEEQDTYSTRVQDGVSIWAIPVTVQNQECVGATMEAMAAQSYRTVTPTYFEIALKVKYSRDEDSVRMLDLIREGVMFNFEIIYNGPLGSPWDVMRNLIVEKKSDFASYWAKKEQGIQKKLEELVSTFN